LVPQDGKGLGKEHPVSLEERAKLRVVSKDGNQAVVADQQNLHHLVTGLNRDDVNAIFKGKIVALPAGTLTGLTEESDVVIMFGETDEDISNRFSSTLRIQTN
jgi:hypothetical protein